MRSFTTKAALAAAFIATSLAGAQAATRVPARHAAEPAASQIVAAADAAFQQISLQRYNRDLSSPDYKWLKTEAENIRAAAIQDSHHGVLPKATYVQLQSRIQQLDNELQRDRAPAFD